MFTTRRYSLEHTEEAFDNEPYEDIYYSTKNVSGEWSEPWMAVTTVNSIYHEATSALTPDGQKLFFYRTTQKEKPGKIFVSKLDGKVWSEPISLNKIINTNDVITSVSITPDEQTLYFVSNKSGSKGGKDIYVTHKDANGVWQEAVNIGEQVNTEYDEESPFIHPDGKTLFFSSQGHNSMGGYDVFKTVFDGEKWSEPENMGYPLNTVEDDLHFVLSANGNNAYYTSTGKDSYGKEDIYQIIMPKTNIPLTMIRGTILCADSLKPLDVNIKLKNVETGEFVRHVYKPNPETGKYLIILPPGKIYDMVITTHGYLPYKLNVFIPNQDKFFELYQTIYLKMVHPFDKKIGQGISVDNAFFNHEGMIIDIERRKKLEELRQQKLQELINKIITTTDTNSFNNLEDAIESNFDQKYKTIGIDSSFSSLLNLVNQVIENTDSVALNHINNIVERGFYTYAEENIFFYGDPIGSIKDTIRVSTNNFTVTQPLNINDSVNFGVGEKNDILKTVSTPSVMLYYVFFDYDEYYLNDSCKSDLTEILKIYNEHPNLKFSITGYADSIGSDDFNLQLSKKRVLAIEQFLVEHLVHSNKIIKIWKGEENPLNNNETEKERAKNRRVEIKLLQE
jgi:outer membrane protein OmpA-like peptidoglycan-associated protein